MKKLGYFFPLKVQRLKTQDFRTKLPSQKPMLRQIQWGLQNETIKKKGVLTLATINRKIFEANSSFYVK